MSIPEKGVQQNTLVQNKGPRRSNFIEKQAGFRSGSSQIHVLLKIIEAFESYQFPLTATFIDFKKGI